MKRILLLIVVLTVRLQAAETEGFARFDHEMHLQKVFKAHKIQCSYCHNFSVNEKKQVIGNDALSSSAFHKTKKQICHECHQGNDVRFRAAPKTCFTCHRSTQSMTQIKPQSHENIGWKTSHALEGRVNGEYCLNCHLTSQCAKCHLRRNDIEMMNHSRNFKLMHSVQARAQPQRCDACHTKSFCINCHVGKK